MQRNVLTTAVAVALAAFGASTANAQSSLTIYGNIDAAIDSVHRQAGTNLFGQPAASSTVTRVSPSIASQSALGFKGTEDIGGGYKASFVLEGQFNADTGVSAGQDSRMWGRQAFVGLTTPFGEVRLGRQYAPIFYAFALSSVEEIGSADLMASGLVVNNLQIRQDNQISYWLKAGDLTGALSYSPNAGVSNKVSAARSGLGGSSGMAGVGQIIGGVSAGDENTTGRGRSYGLFVNYVVDPALRVMGGYHYNSFGDALLVSIPGRPVPTSDTLAKLDKYIGYVLGAKYTVPGMGTVIGGNFTQGKFTNDAGSMEGPDVQVLTFGVKHPIDQFAVGVEGVYARFTNFTKGKDLGLMFAGDYNFSKRTRVYARAGTVKDSGGNSAATDSSAVKLIGGPLPVLTGIGSLEIPFFAGGDANANAWTRVFSVGIRHQF
jgi:predicted porin